MSINVLNLGRVAPGDQCHLDPESGGQAPPLLGTGSVLAVYDRQEDSAIQRRGLEQLLQADAPVRHPLADAFDLFHGNRALITPKVAVLRLPIRLGALRALDAESPA